MNRSESRFLLIGIGNDLRGDDGVGPSIVRRIRRTPLSQVDFVEASGEGAALIEAWRDFSTVYVFDAVSSGGTPGEIVRFDAGREEIPSRYFNYSTHAFSLAEAVELARALDRLPPTLTVYGIEGQDFSHGPSLSKAVALAANSVADQVVRELETAAKMREGDSSCTNSK
jgi:hydrogenase maturation protease